MASRAKQVAADPPEDPNPAKKPRVKKTAAQVAAAVAAAASAGAGSSPVPTKKSAAKKPASATPVLKKGAKKVVAPAPVAEEASSAAAAAADPHVSDAELMDLVAEDVPAPAKAATTTGKKIRAAEKTKEKKKKTAVVRAPNRVPGINHKRKPLPPGERERREILKESKRTTVTAIKPASYEGMARLIVKKIDPTLSLFSLPIRKLHINAEQRAYKVLLRARDNVILSKKKTLWPEHLQNAAAEEEKPF